MAASSDPYIGDRVRIPAEGRLNNASMVRLKIVAFAPIPSARHTTAIAAKAGLRRNARAACHRLHARFSSHSTCQAARESSLRRDTDPNSRLACRLASSAGNPC